MALPLDEWGVESREGVAPSRAGLQPAILARGSAHDRADSGNRTRIGSLENCGPTVERCPRSPARRARGRVVEQARFELALPGCKPGVLPLNYSPMFSRLATRAGRDGIEPPLRDLESRWPPWLYDLETATRLRRGFMFAVCTPRGIRRAPRTEIESVSLRRQRSCDASRITRQKPIASPAGVEPASRRFRKPVPIRSATRT